MSQYHRYDEHGDALLKSEEFQKARREMRRVLWRPGQREDRCVSITRRIFLHKVLLGGTAAAVASEGGLRRLNPLDMAFAQRSEERRVGYEGVSTGRSRWAPSN